MTRQEELNEAWCKYMGECSTEIMQALAFALRWADAHPDISVVSDPKTLDTELGQSKVTKTSDQEDFKARVSMVYEGREQWDAFLDRVWLIHTSELPHWISVEDELPKEHGAYLVFKSVTSTEEIYIYSNGNWWYNAVKCPSGVITHWMPLPKMPILSNSENIGKDEKGRNQ